ncbi:MAG: sigma-70 family RNA polymerase sigma factor [Kofleriaceae bacterium]
MPTDSPDPFESQVRALIDAGDIDRATDLTVRQYGPELVGWLTSILPGEADAQDAFGWMSEELWRSLKRFDGRCSMRTWCYMLARHAATRQRKQPRREHEQLVSSVPSLVHAVTHVWNTTRANAAQVRDVYAEIRKSLDEDDETLLVLRVDRDLAWRDIAIVMLGEDAEADDVTKKAAALRKQFERVKEHLKELAAEKLVD